MIGQSLSHYNIVEELGRGGMGIVYKAEDTKLDRTVAIKVLPSAALATDDDRARFYREAKAAAQLHHPNIASVFEIDEAVPSEAPHDAQPSPFIAMEYIDGETLYDLVQKGPLKLTDAVNIASQVAEALKAAHSKDIVHRDIKSSNVMLTSDGTAKVLDFGLAKTEQSTMLTRLGSTLGTVAYMSPEQARGQEVDGRSDLYSLGTMLYEMICGKKPFAGDYEQAVVYGILNEKPESLTAIRTGVPMGLEWIVDKLLAKEPDYRYQTAADLLADLKTVDLSGSGHSRRSMVAATGSVRAAVAEAEAVPGRAGGFPMWGWGAIAIAVLAGAGAGWIFKPAPASVDHPPVRFEIALPAEESIRRREQRAVTISPDGSMIAYTTSEGVRLRHTSNIESSALLEGLSNAREIFFSPDSRWLGYVNFIDGVLLRVSTSGGSEIPIADLPSEVRGASWGNDDHIYMGFGIGGMGRVPFSGGAIEMFVPGSDSLDIAYHGPQLLPNQREIIYTHNPIDADWDASEIRLYDLESGESKLLHPSGREAHYVNSGHLVYIWRNTAYAIPFDPDRGQLLGTQTPVMDRVATSLSGVSGSAHIGFSDNGTLVKYRGENQDFGDGAKLYWVTPDGAEVISPDERNFTVTQVSPTGEYIAAQLGFLPAADRRILLVNAIRGTIDHTIEGSGMPTWSPDGEQMVYGHGSHMLVTTITDPESVDTLYSEPSGDFVDPTDWSSDGRYIVYNRERQGDVRMTSIYWLDLETNETRPFLNNDVDIDYARFSPGDQWLAYEFGPAGNSDIIIRRFPSAESRQVIVETGQKPVWRPDGKAVLYTNTNRQVYEIEVDLENGTIGAPRMVAALSTAAQFGFFDVHPIDGRVLLPSTGSEVPTASSTLGSSILDVVVNWTSTLPKAQE